MENRKKKEERKGEIRLRGDGQDGRRGEGGEVMMIIITIKTIKISLLIIIK